MFFEKNMFLWLKNIIAYCIGMDELLCWTFLMRYCCLNYCAFDCLFSSITQHKINTVAINPSCDWLAFGSSSLGQLLVWEWQSETYVLKQQGHFYNMNVMSYSPDGQYIATGGDDAKVCFLVSVFVFLCCVFLIRWQFKVER